PISPEWDNVSHLTPMFNAMFNTILAPKKHNLESEMSASTDLNSVVSQRPQISGLT
ncbi:MAG: hypothetical protein ACI9CE_003941, partial [Flavobacterium sp.]